MSIRFILPFAWTALLGLSAAQDLRPFEQASQDQFIQKNKALTNDWDTNEEKKTTSCF